MEEPIPQIAEDIANSIDALRFQVRAISNEIQEKHSDVDSRKAKSRELGMRLDELSKKLSVLVTRSGISLRRASSLKEMSEVMAETAVDERSKPEVSEYRKEEEMNKVQSVSPFER